MWILFWAKKTIFVKFHSGVVIGLSLKACEKIKSHYILQIESAPSSESPERPDVYWSWLRDVISSERESYDLMCLESSVQDNILHVLIHWECFKNDRRTLALGSRGLPFIYLNVFSNCILSHIFIHFLPTFSPSAYAKYLNDDILRLIRICAMLPAHFFFPNDQQNYFLVKVVNKNEHGREKAVFLAEWLDSSHLSSSISLNPRKSLVNVEF